MLGCTNKHLELKASIYEGKPTKKNLPKIIMCGSSRYTMDKLFSILDPRLQKVLYSIGSSMKRISKIKKWSTAAFTPQEGVAKVKTLV